MRYLTLHHNAYWFQIRVPASLRARYGQVVRVNLQTADRAVAHPLSLRLAAEWLTRFSLIAADSEPPAAWSDAFLTLPEALMPPSGGKAAPSDSSGQRPRLFQAFEYWRDLTPGRPERTVMEFQSTADLFDARVGKAMADLQRSDIAGFRDSLLREGRGAATVRKRVGFVSAMLQTQFDAGRLATNVARGLRVPQLRAEATGRTEFSAAQLDTLFTSPVYREQKRPLGGGGEAAAWLPLMGLATGARLEEMCQLRVADVSFDPTHGFVLRIQDDGIETRLKTASSRRLVPLHPQFIACGFDAYITARKAHGDVWLFPDLVPDVLGNRSGNFTKWFGRYLRSPNGCGIEDRRIVFHSLRHTFKTLCRAVMSEELHDAATGHAGGVGRSYGSVPLAALVEAVHRIQFPVLLPTIPVR